MQNTLLQRQLYQETIKGILDSSFKGGKLHSLIDVLEANSSHADFLKTNEMLMTFLGELNSFVLKNEIAYPQPPASRNGGGRTTNDDINAEKVGHAVGRFFVWFLLGDDKEDRKKNILESPEVLERVYEAIILLPRKIMSNRQYNKPQTYFELIKAIISLLNYERNENALRHFCDSCLSTDAAYEFFFFAFPLISSSALWVGQFLFCLHEMFKHSEEKCVREFGFSAFLRYIEEAEEHVLPASKVYSFVKSKLEIEVKRKQDHNIPNRFHVNAEVVAAKNELESLLVAFFQIHAPYELGRVSKIVEQQWTKPDSCLKQLTEMYGVV